MAPSEKNVSEWELYAGHRQHFTRLVLARAPSGGRGRLCVLGAGKCNDLDLEQLAEAFGELHLVDLEPAAVASAVARQPAALRSKLFPHAPVDLAVLTPKRAAKWKRKPPSAAELEASVATARRDLLRRLPGPFNVVVSACVITQLGFALTRALSETHPVLSPLRLATLRLHLELLSALGGSVLCVTDLASSTHYPLDTLAPDVDLDAVIQDVIEKRAFYHLARPDLLRDLLGELTEREPEPVAPWLWTGPQRRTYLVYGLAVTRD